ncbi:hypothetical protein GCM10010307_56650 [Streptomyces vastus]|uniref:Uncharacterized protein n=1 Tax=Streptomyces vastus TaxID=285451 RepID=A0ABN3RBW7_9ACTN
MRDAHRLLVERYYQVAAGPGPYGHQIPGTTRARPSGPPEHGPRPAVRRAEPACRAVFCPVASSLLSRSRRSAPAVGPAGAFAPGRWTRPDLMG